MTDDLRIDDLDLLGNSRPGEIPWYYTAVCTGCRQRFTWPAGAGHDLAIFLRSPRTPDEVERIEDEIRWLLAQPRTQPMVAGITCW